MYTCFPFLRLHLCNITWMNNIPLMNYSQVEREKSHLVCHLLGLCPKALSIFIMYTLKVHEKHSHSYYGMIVDFFIASLHNFLQ